MHFRAILLLFLRSTHLCHFSCTILNRCDKGSVFRKQRVKELQIQGTSWKQRVKQWSIYRYIYITTLILDVKTCVNLWSKDWEICYKLCGIFLKDALIFALEYSIITGNYALSKYRTLHNLPGFFVTELCLCTSSVCVSLPS